MLGCFTLSLPRLETGNQKDDRPQAFEYRHCSEEISTHIDSSNMGGGAGRTRTLSRSVTQPLFLLGQSLGQTNPETRKILVAQ